MKITRLKIEKYNLTKRNTAKAISMFKTNRRKRNRQVKILTKTVKILKTVLHSIKK
jgi:hypothetical protein